MSPRCGRNAGNWAKGARGTSENEGGGGREEKAEVAAEVDEEERGGRGDRTGEERN